MTNRATKQGSKTVWITALVTRLCQLPAQDLTQFMDGQEIRNSLGKVLEKARSEDHATRVVDQLTELIEGRTPFRPTPAEVKAMIQRTPAEPPPTLQAPSRNCPACAGTGLVRNWYAKWIADGKAHTRKIGSDTEISQAATVRGVSLAAIAYEWAADIGIPERSEIIDASATCACRKVPDRGSDRLPPQDPDWVRKDIGGKDAN